jgi:hypothetical protein
VEALAIVDGFDEGADLPAVTVTVHLFRGDRCAGMLRRLSALSP